MINIEMNDNPRDFRGVYSFRFKWKPIINMPPKDIKFIVMKMNPTSNSSKYFFESISKNQEKSVLSEILNVKILRKIGEESKSFKVIGAKGRNIIIGEIDLSEFEDNIKKLLIISSLKDWRTFNSNK